MKVRLKTNLIADGKFIERGSIIDDELLTDRIKGDTSIVSYDLEDREKAMLLREMNFNKASQQLDDEGFNVSRPVMLAAGELIPAEEVPAGWVEGKDFKFGWTPDERRLVQEQESAAYLKQFQSHEDHDVTGNRRGFRR
jgi:hypothetical protein